MDKTELDDFLLKGNLNLLPATFIDEKDTQILSRITSLMRYCPEENLYSSLLFSLLRFPKEFKKIRSIGHLGRMVSAEHFYKKRVLEAVDLYPHKRHLFVKIFKTNLEYPFGSKAVLGTLITFNFLKQREAFEEQHVLEAVQRIIEGAKVVRGSFLDHFDKNHQILSVYLEIERDERPEFSLEELEALQTGLAEEFKGCIEQLVPVTFMRRNEEEVYRNILTLRDQLKAVKDIPQATITFEEQTHFDLYFTIVLLRIAKHNTPTVQELFEKHHPDIIYIPDRTDTVGVVRKNYHKEATIFRLQLPKSLFFRKDRSVNLYKARQHVLAMLIKALGPIRDFNGGLIFKQNERLDDFLALMPKVHDEFLLENFFYSISPIAMQSILPAQLIREWYLAFSELLEKEMLQKETYQISFKQIEEVTLIIVKGDENSFKKPLLKEIALLGIPSLELAFSEIHRHGTFCLGFIYRPSMLGKEKDFCNAVRDSMEKWSANVGEEPTLRIVLQGSEPSLDPRVIKDDKSHVLIKMLFEGLTRRAPDGSIEMAVAESYEASANFRKYTFHLRKCQWSNGMSITAHDFEYSWKTALQRTPHAHTFYPIKNARLAGENKASLNEVGVYALDEKTLVVELEYSIPYFLEIVAHPSYSLINRAIDRKYPGWAHQAGESYVCNGPFKLVDWKHSRSITVEKNSRYWDADKVRLNKIIVSMIDKHLNEVKLLEKGEIDLFGHPLTSFPLEEIAPLLSDLEVKTFSHAANGLLIFNTNQFPFNHKKIRQAFGFAIDREKIRIQETLVKLGDESYSLLPSKLSLHKHPVFPKADLAIARNLFREGLGEIGFVKSDFPKITISYFVGYRHLAFFKSLCQQWKEAFDIDVHMEEYEWEPHLKRLREGDFQMGFVESAASWNDPLHLMEYFEERENSMNFSFWEHPDYQRLLSSAKGSQSLELRNCFLKAAEAFLAEEMPFVPLFEIEGRYFQKIPFKGISISEFSQIDFKWAYKEV